MKGDTAFITQDNAGPCEVVATLKGGSATLTYEPLYPYP